MGIGGLGIGDWPNPQSPIPIPNPHSDKIYTYNLCDDFYYYNFVFIYTFIIYNILLDYYH
jgi:hypothetical protein